MGLQNALFPKEFTKHTLQYPLKTNQELNCLMPVFLKPLVANMFLAVAVFSLLWTQPAFAQSPQTFVMALASAPTTLDSRFATGASASRIADLISQPLVTLDETFAPMPAAAKSHTWLDDKTLQLTLESHRFVNGEPLTAETVKAFYENIKDSETASPYKGQLAPIKTIEAVDARTVQFVFGEKPAFVWPLFTHPIMLPDQSLDGADSAVRPVGLGPYKVAQNSSLDDLTLELAEYWQGKPPASHTLRFKTVKDPLVRLLKVQEGEAHLLQNDMPLVFYHYAQKKTGLKTISAPSTNYTYLGFNIDDTTTGKLALREAIAYALDRQKIMDTLLFGLATPAESILPGTHPAFWPAPLRPHDPQKAIDMLEAAGFKADENGVRVRLRFSTTNNPSTLLLVQAIQHQLRQVGIDLRTNVSEWGTFYGNILKGNFQMYLLTWVGEFDADIYRSIFHSGKKPPVGANRGRFHSAEMDDLIDGLWQQGADRPTLTKKIQQLQHDLLPYVPLWQRHNIAIMHPQVRGFTLTPDGSYHGLLNTYVQKEVN